VNQQKYLISFDEVSPAEASVYADELRNALLDASDDIIIQRKRDYPQTQDFGATLVLILGTPTAVALTKTIATVIENWLKLRTSASLTVKTADEHLIVRNITSKQATELTKIFLKRR
jgi:hypothetical protein